MDPVFFTTPADFRQWLEKHHDKATELLVGFYKTSTGKPSITWPQSVDEALCFGWIDGIRRSLGEESYCIRFTPRKPGSIWSAVNIEKIAQLTAAGRMHPTGLAAYEKRSEKKSKIYSYEKEPVTLDKGYEKLFRSHAGAWEFFSKQSPSYQRLCIHWIMDAKQEKTRQSRLATLVTASGAGKRIR